MLSVKLDMKNRLKRELCQYLSIVNRKKFLYIKRFFSNIHQHDMKNLLKRELCQYLTIVNRKKFSYSWAISNDYSIITRHQHDKKKCLKRELCQ